MDLKIDKNDLLFLMELAEYGLGKAIEGKSRPEILLSGFGKYAELIESIRGEAVKVKEGEK